MNAGRAAPRNQPELAQLFREFLNRRLAAQQLGTAEWDAQAGEVVPHQAAAALAVDPRTALAEGLQAAKLLLAAEDAKGFSPNAFRSLPDWGLLVRAKENTLGVAFALGNFPQMLQTIQPLLEPGDLIVKDAGSRRPIPACGLAEWAEKQLAKQNWAGCAFAAAASRLAGDFAAAQTLLAKARTAAPASADHFLRNEEAALAWHAGEYDRAAQLWAAHPRQDALPVLFNRGLSALFAGQNEQAAAFFNQALEHLPDDDAWRHLAQLYVLLAEGT